MINSWVKIVSTLFFVYVIFFLYIVIKENKPVMISIFKYGEIIQMHRRNDPSLFCSLSFSSFLSVKCCLSLITSALLIALLYVNNKTQSIFCSSSEVALQILIQFITWLCIETTDRFLFKWRLGWTLDLSTASLWNGSLLL